MEIQPPGRREEEKFKLARRDVGAISWKRLDKSGPAGLFLVLLGLNWWKMMIGDADSDWSKAVIDVTWALHEMKSRHEGVSTNKRKRCVTYHLHSHFLI